VASVVVAVTSAAAIQSVSFGGYALLERLAMGGMAEVFLGRPDGQARFVAVKRILPSIAADDDFIAMFIDEAKIAGQLTHPHIAQILDIGKINNSYFIAMEYVSGPDLRALWDRVREANVDGVRGLPIELACHLVKKLAEGLDHAHRKRDSKGRPLGIIHRDVSPQNVLVSYDGDLKIIDFGIAKAANRIVRTQTGILKGKFAYMAPEQARGEPIDHRADIFAIGVVLYELLTGERAFKGDSDFVLLEKVRRVDVTPVRDLRPDVPRELERIVMKALGREANERYAWASALAGDLDRFLSDQGLSTSREELGAFVRRAFRAEFAEESERLQRYRGDARLIAADDDGVDEEAPTLLGDIAHQAKRLDEAPSEVRKAARRRTDSRGPGFPDPPPSSSSSRAAARRREQTPQPLIDGPPSLSVTTPDERRRARDTARSLDVPPLLADTDTDALRRARDDRSDEPLTETEVPPPLHATSSHRRPRRAGNGVVVAACLLGAGLGAALGMGASMATRAPPPDALIVITPRQTEVRRGESLLCAQTPCAVHLGAGRHELQLKAPGAAAVNRLVEIGEGAAVVDLVLDQMASGVRVESDPPGASVSLNDVVLAQPTPLTLPPMQVGNLVKLTLRKEGFDDVSIVRSVDGDGLWKFEMPSPTTAWSLTAVPADAVLRAGRLEGMGHLELVGQASPVDVAVSRPGCAGQTLGIGRNGRAAFAQVVQLQCPPLTAMLSFDAPRRPASIKIDGIAVARGADLDAYPMPPGTWSVVVVSPRGKREAFTIETRDGETTRIVSHGR
jgi:serine/threonine protein kinase